MQSLWTGLSALNASSSQLNQIAGNIANVDTVGYGETNSSFEDMLTTHMSPNATAPTVSGRYTEPGLWDGTGVLNTQLESNFDGMGIKKTGNQYDFALTNSDQFFAVKDPSGGTLYTKAGNFELSEHPGGTANLVTTSGQNVLDSNGNPITIPKGVHAIQVGTDGQITFDNGQKGPQLGVVEINTPSQFLTAAGDNNYTLKQGVQAPAFQAGQSTWSPNVVQGSLTTNNVDLTKEMTSMIKDQNFYESNAKALNIADKMMQIDNQIKP